jgi:predicted Zn finger-like uncharacterized protein
MGSFYSRGGPADRSAPATPEKAAPSACPSCQSTSITTTAKVPDSTSYWRCTKCGDVWNASRRSDPRHGRYRWQ